MSKSGESGEQALPEVLTLMLVFIEKNHRLAVLFSGKSCLIAVIWRRPAYSA